MPEAEPAIGRLLMAEELAQWPDGPLRSAFVISGTHALSAWHCVLQVGGESARSWLLLQPSVSDEDYVAVPVRYEAHDSGLDAALLSVDVTRIRDAGGQRAANSLFRYLAGVALPLGESAHPLEVIRIGGFPERNPAIHPVVLAGHIDSTDALIGTAKAIRLSVPAFGARFPERPDGMSGGPLLRRFEDGRERVVGIVSAYPRALGDQGATGGTVLCRRITDLCDVFPSVRAAVSKSGLGENAGQLGLAHATMLTTGSMVYICGGPGNLATYRTAAADVCRRHGLVPVELTDPSPANTGSVVTHRRMDESCRLLVLLLGDDDGEPVVDAGLTFTESVYDWARARGIPSLPFQVTEGLSPAGQTARAATKTGRATDTAALAAFQKRVARDQDVIPLWDLSYFRLDLYQAIEPYKRARPEPAEYAAYREYGRFSVHRERRNLPSPPAMCAMPIYVGGTPFTGRILEISSLDDWARSADPVQVVEAIGGLGKSALTWEWAMGRASTAIPGLAGRFWWSFYDGSPSMERFLRELLAYLRDEPATGQTISQTGKEELASAVIDRLVRRPYLVVLDGFERLLMAYHQYDPSKVTDYDVDNDRRANKHAMIDPTAYDLVRRLNAAAPSKILVSTRMTPDALERPGGGLLPGVRRLRLPGLDNADALALVRRLGVDGDAPQINEFFSSLGNHPLLIAIVAGMVRDYRKAPGSFGAWQRGHSFKLRKLDLKARQHHILDAALAGLEPLEARLLRWLSVLQGSVQWEVLESINPYLEVPGITPATAGGHLDAALRDLEVRGLVWWNRTANTYDMHPVVRAFAYEDLDGRERVSANQRIRDHFRSRPPSRHESVSSVEDLQQTITLFRALTGALQYTEATRIWNNQLAGSLLVNLGAHSSVAELLQPYEQTDVTRLRADLSISLHLARKHEHGLAVELRTLEQQLRRRDKEEVRISLGRAATHYRAIGRLAAYASIVTLLETGQAEEPATALRRAILDALTGRGPIALRALSALEHGPAPASSPWFPGDVRYWQLLVRHWQGDSPSLAEVSEAESAFPTWRSKLRFAELRFDILLGHGSHAGDSHADGKRVADEIDRLRRLGGQELIPAENAISLASLGREAEAEAVIMECINALPRVHEFDRPYYQLAVALCALGRRAEATEMALLARRQAWADGPEHSHQWNLGRAETFLVDLGASLPPLPRTRPEDVNILLQRRVETFLTGRRWRR